MGKSILIVDDEALIGTSLAKVLESEGYETQLAHSGREGLDAALPPSVDERDEEVDLAIGRLQDAILTNRLLAHLGGGGTFDDWMIATRAGESLPPLLLGDTALDALVNEVARYCQTRAGQRPGLSAGTPPTVFVMRSPNMH